MSPMDKDALLRALFKDLLIVNTPNGRYINNSSEKQDKTKEAEVVKKYNEIYNQFLT